MVQRAGFGVSSAISVGDDALIGSPPARLLRQFKQDPARDRAVVLFSEPGTQFEEQVAEIMMQGHYNKATGFCYWRTLYGKATGRNGLGLRHADSAKRCRSAEQQNARHVRSGYIGCRTV